MNRIYPNSPNSEQNKLLEVVYKNHFTHILRF